MLVGVALGEGIEQIDVPEQEIVEFPRGLVGFEEFSRYALLCLEGCLFLLQAIDDPMVGFVLSDPRAVDPDYCARLTLEDRMLLELGEEDAPEVLCIVTLSEDGVPSAINLRAPIVFNLDRKLGAQAILQESRYPVRYPVAVSAKGGGFVPAGALGISHSRSNVGNSKAGSRAVEC